MKRSSRANLFYMRRVAQAWPDEEVGTARRIPMQGKFSPIGPNAAIDGGVRGHAELYGSDCSIQHMHWYPSCRAAWVELDDLQRR
jgi:hypothetical protein